MKYYMIFMLSILMSMMSVKANTTCYVDGIYYELDYTKKEAMVTYDPLLKGYKYNVVIPSRIVYMSKSYTVTSIGQGAFINSSDLTSVTIPKSVTSIGQGAFSGCSSLTSVSIPNSVTEIGEMAFYRCSGLTSVVIPKSVKTIGNLAFAGVSHVTISSNVTSIGETTFSGLSSLTIQILDIKDWCTNPLNISLSSSCNCYYYVNGEEVKDLKIPNNVTSIGEKAFCNGKGLTSVTIPNSVTSIEKSAFEGCGELTSVTIGNSVTSIGENVFHGCDGLKNVKSLNSTPPVIESSTFDTATQKNAMFEVPIDCGYKYANADGWNNCDIIYSVTSGDKKLYPVPINVNGGSIISVNGVEKDGLEIEEGETITIVALHDLELYETIYHNGMDVSNDVCRHGLYSFTASRNHKNNVIETFVYTPVVLQQSNSGSLLENVGVENIEKVQNLKIIGNINGTDILVIRKMSNLLYLDMSEANIVDGGGSYYENYITSTNKIGDHFFAGMKKMTKVILPNKVTSIGNYAFSGLNNLKSVTISNSVNSIGQGAFQRCGLKSITIPNSVLTIGADAFMGSLLTSVTIPNSVVSIGRYAFESCRLLTSITIGNSVTSLDYGVFARCGNLTSVTIPNSVKSIEFGAFRDCIGLTSVTLPNSITSIKDEFFLHCSRLTSVTIPNSIISIGMSAFAGCVGLTSITIPNSVKSIKYGAFEDCSGLTSVTIGNDVTSIADNAFKGCIGLNEVVSLNTIPPKITYSTFDEETQKNAILNVPIECKNIYWLNPVWEKFLNISEGIEKDTYSLTYIIDGDVYRSYKLQEGQAIVPESAPTKEGYTFSGWSLIPETMPANDVTITGSFTIVDDNQDINVDDGGRWIKYIVTSGTVGVATHEDYPNLFDNDTNTKWCVTDVSGTIYVEFDATQSIKPIGYVLTTAVDTYPACLDRNPKSWMIKGRNSTSDKWTTLATIADGVMPTSNCTSKTFTLDTQSAYRYYRFEVTTLVGGDIFQLSEFCFLVDGINSETSDEDPDDINDINVDDGTFQIYTLEGKQIETLQKGVNIIKYGDGNSQKVYVK